MEMLGDEAVLSLTHNKLKHIDQQILKDYLDVFQFIEVDTDSSLCMEHPHLIGFQLYGCVITATTTITSTVKQDGLQVSQTQSLKVLQIHWTIISVIQGVIMVAGGGCTVYMPAEESHQQAPSDLAG